MKIPTLPFAVTDRSRVGPTRHPGEGDRALRRTLEAGDLRVRRVEYAPGDVADQGYDLGRPGAA